jgi:hypothetical protein
MREPFAVVQDSGSVFFLFFPMVGEFHRAFATMGSSRNEHQGLRAQAQAEAALGQG